MDANDRTPEQPEQPEQGPSGEQPPPPGGQPPPPGGQPPPGPHEQPTQPLGEQGAAGPRRLMRSRSDRVLGGVAGGLGRYFNVDPILFRIGAVVLTILGGAGVLLYLAMLLLVPNEPGPETPAGAQPTAAAPEGRNRTLVIVGVVALLLVTWPILLGGGLALAGLLVPLAILVAIGVLVWWLVSGEGPSGDARDIARRAALGFGVLLVCWVIAIGGAWAAAAGGEAVVAAIVITAGIAVLVGAFMRPVRWLILPAVVLALSAGAVSAAGIDLDGGVGDRDYRPGSVGDLRDRYELGMGELVVDLRDTDLPPGDTPVAIDLGVGAARLLVPDDVCVATRAQVGMGAIEVFNRDNGGIDLDWDELPSAPADTSRLVVDADIGVGHLDVDHDTEDFRFRGRFRDDDFEFDSSADSVDDPGNTACRG